MKKRNGIIFDLDGTIIDTLTDLKEALNFVLTKHGFPQVSAEDAKRYVGNGMRELIRKALPESQKQNESLLDKMHPELIAYYHENLLNNTVPYDGFYEFFKLCNENGIKLGVSSNKSNDESKLLIKTLFPGIEFSEVLGNRPGHPHKPNPEQTDEIIEKMGIPKDEIIYAGDSITDYHTANMAGLDMVLVNYGYEDPGVLENLPGVELLNSPQELIARLSEMII